MQTRTPVDPTSTAAWQALTAHQEAMQPDLRAWFAADPGRAERLTHTVGDLHVDLSKNLVTDETLDLLLGLAEEVGLAERIGAMLAGEHINVTEDRAVLHTALRRPAGATPPLVVDGQDVDGDVQAVLDKVYAFAEKVRSGAWTGVTGKPVATVVNIGIGGSDLGPVMAYEALKPYVQPGLEVRFVSNIDPTDMAETVADLDPTTTLFIVASKTFTTLETLTNARLARAWLWRRLVEVGAIEDTDDARTEAVAQALRRGVDRAGQGRGVRHRPVQRLRLLGLGRRPLLDGLRDRHLARGGDRPRRLRAAAGRLPRRRRAPAAHAVRAQRAGADGPAQRLVHELLGRAHPRRAALRRSTCTASPRTCSS